MKTYPSIGRIDIQILCLVRWWQYLDLMNWPVTVPPAIRQIQGTLCLLCDVNVDRLI